MKSQLLIALKVGLITMVLTGLFYPLLLTGLAGLIFPAEAGGSLARDGEGNIVGSELIGQKFTDAAYFHPRPSAAGDGYDALSSGGSNLGPSSRKLREMTIAEIARVETENPEETGPVPLDLITASGSGLDPHVSLEGARYQIKRIALARKVSVDRVASVVNDSAEVTASGIFSQASLNVLKANLMLDARFGKPRKPVDGGH